MAAVSCPPNSALLCVLCVSALKSGRVHLHFWPNWKTGIEPKSRKWNSRKKAQEAQNKRDKTGSAA
jgi:hypothetical protein